MAKAPIVTFAASADMKAAIDEIAAKKHISSSELIRGYIESGMNVSKASSDIDFIRAQIRAELDPIVKSYSNRVIKLLVRVGIMTVSLCFFTAKILHIFTPRGDRGDYEELLAQCKKEAAAYLSLRDSIIEGAFRDFEENNPL